LLQPAAAAARDRGSAWNQNRAGESAADFNSKPQKTPLHGIALPQTGRFGGNTTPASGMGPDAWRGL
jgi:hypothetical protein